MLIGITANSIGMIELAAGTIVPDSLPKIFVARAGAGNMSISNVIVKNMFDILLGLGLPWFWEIGFLKKVFMQESI